MQAFGHKGRLEDARMLTGRGRYVSDWQLPGQAHGHFVRSDRAHAEIVSIDKSSAVSMPGVIAVLTGEDIEAAGLKPLPAAAPMKGRGGADQLSPRRPALAQGRVRYVGDPVALVVAETAAQAQDAAETVMVEYRELPAVIDAARGARAGRAAAAREQSRQPGPRLRRRRRGGDQAAFERAARVVKLNVVSHARGRQPDGAARRDRRRTTRRTRPISSTPRRRAPPPMRGQMATDARRAAGEGARGRRGGGRRLRRALQHLPGVWRRCSLAAKQARPPGEMGRHALGGVPRRRAGARHRAHRRDGARRRAGASSACASTISPTSAPTSRSPGRFVNTMNLVNVAERRLRRAGGARAGEARADQHRAHGGLPRRGPAGRAPTRIERLVDQAAHELGMDPARVPPPQPGAEGRSFPTRSSPASSTTAAISRACSTRRCKPPTGTGFEARRTGSSQARQAARPRHLHLHRGERRRRLRALRPGA